MGALRDGLIDWLQILLLCLLCVSVIVFIIVKLRQVSKGNWFDLAFRDDLTGLLNKNAYRQKIRELKIRKDMQTWLLVFDIDDFKQINDTQGHLQGDRVLIESAQRLKNVFFAPQYVLYRFGGDEFVVLAENVRKEQVQERLLYLREVERHEETFLFSKGYAMVKKRSADAVEQAFAEADHMLYEDKQLKKAQR